MANTATILKHNLTFKYGVYLSLRYFRKEMAQRQSSRLIIERLSVRNPPPNTSFLKDPIPGYCNKDNK